MANQMIGVALAYLSAFFIFALMILEIPYEAALIRAMDYDVQLVQSCEHGHAIACQNIDTDAAFKQKICTETESMQGTCLYISEHGVAIRTRHGSVTNVLERAKALLD